MEVLSKMNKKAEFSTTGYLVGVMIFSAVIALAYLMVGDLATNYGASNVIDSDFESKYNKFEENTDNFNDIRGILDSNESVSFIDVGEVFFKGTLSLLTFTKDSFGIFNSQIMNIGEDFGVPSAVTGIIFVLFLAALIVAITILFINVIMKLRRL